MFQYCDRPPEGYGGGGSEFALACDIRFASREKAIFGQPEVGFGMIPGPGERLIVSPFW